MFVPIGRHRSISSLPSVLFSNFTLVLRVELGAVVLSFVGLELGLPFRWRGLDLSHPVS